MIRYFLFFFLYLSAYVVVGQNTSVSGVISDKETYAAVPFAQVVLVQLPDSTVKPTQTELDGSFSFQNVESGRYALKVMYLGYKPFRQVIQVAAQPLRLGNIALEEDVEKLKEVEVVGKAPPVVQKGDTSEFNSRAFKTNPDASAEDMVQKMPGITVQNGKVQAQGEDVKQVLVDGKQFFGDDATAVLKNLPAEVIDKIQVFDQQSDQAQFSGVNDGNTSKTINIVTKPDMRNGKFGRVYAGAGTDNRYQAGGNLNIMNGDRRISIVGQANNVNQQNFSSEDLLGVTASGGGNRGGRGGQGGMRGGGSGNWGSGGNDFQVNQRNGIAKTHALGINYSDQWSKKIEVSGSYFLNATDNLAQQEVFRQYVLKANSGQVYTENSRSDAMNINHRLNFRFDWKLDSMNSLLIRPRLSLQQNDGSSNLFGSTLTGNELLNSTENNLKMNLLGYNFSNDILYRHRFVKKGRVFSANFSTVFNGNQGERFLLAENLSYTDGGLDAQYLNQFSDLQTNGPTFGTNLTYNEPVSENGSLSVEYNVSLRKNDADQKTYNFSETGKVYTDLNAGLSNVLSSNYLAQSGGFGYRYNNKTFSGMVRLNYQYANLQSEQEFPYQTDINRTFNNLLPFAMLRYNITKDRNLRVFYRTSTNPPSVNQLQNVIDNTNPLLLSAGNPNLAQDFRHSLNVRYSSANPGKLTNFFLLVSGELAENYVANSTTIAQSDLVLEGGIFFPRGAPLTRPVNLDGFYRLRTFATYGMPISFIKSNLNLNASATFSRSPGLINDRLNYANMQAYSTGLVLSSNISENVDFTLSTSPTYNIVRNTLRTGSNNNFYSQNSGARLNWIIWKGFFVQSELSHQYYTGLSQDFNQSFLLWNAAIGKKLFKNNRGEIKLSAFDLLKQNNSIQRNITETYIEDVETTILQQYFMLVFTYNIRAFGSGK